MFCGAIDLHSDKSTIGIVNEQGERVFKKSLSNDLKGIQKVLEPFRGEMKGIVVESTYNWYWLVDGLMGAGYQVHLGNTTASKQYSGLKHGDDVSDAFWLADLLRLGLLKEGYIYPAETRPVRDLLRKRGRLVEQRTRNIISIENLTTRNLGSGLKTRQVKQLTVAEIDRAYTDENLALAVSSTLRIVQALDDQIRLIEKRVKEQVKLASTAFCAPKQEP